MGEALREGRVVLDLLDRSTGKVASRRKDLNFAYISSSEFNGHKSIRNSSTIDGMVVRLAYIEES